jgi:hypothetical protein
MTRTPETKKKISQALKGKTSKLKGRAIGSYDSERVESAANGMRAAFNGPDGPAIRQRISDAQKERHYLRNIAKK